MGEIDLELSQEEIAQLVSLGVTGSFQRGVTIIGVDNDHLTVGGVAPLAPLGRILYANATFEGMSGRSSEQLLGSSFEKILIGPDTDPEQVSRLREALTGQLPDTFRLLCYHSSGRTFWDSVSIAPISSSAASLRQMDRSRSSLLNELDQTRPVCTSPTLPLNSSFFLVLHDDVSSMVSEQAGFKLRDQALHSCAEGITIVDPCLPDSPIVYANEAFLQMTGYSREEVMGRNCRFMQGPGTSRSAVARLRKALSQQHKCTVQLLNYRKDGQEFWNLLSVTPIFDANGRLSSYIGVQSDITELIHSKEEERRAIAAKAAAEATMEAKAMFLANMSHEIRTPLNGMMAMAQLLLSSSLSPEQRDIAETILESGNSLLGILGDILDFSKLDQGDVVLKKDELCIRGTVEACIEMVAQDALKKHLSVAYLIDDNVLSRPLLGDPVRVRQVLANLLANAVKFTLEGEIVVRVTLERAASRLPSEVGGPCQHQQASSTLNSSSCNGRPSSPTSVSAAPRGSVTGSCSSLTLSSNRSRNTSRTDKSPCHDVIHFSVQDSGIGISEAQASKLFQCFKQGSETMSRRYGGTGLGLAICRRLTELMHGEVWVESEPGRGSTFHFTMEAEWPPAMSPPDDPKRMHVTSWPESNHYEADISRSSSLAQINPFAVDSNVRSEASGRCSFSNARLDGAASQASQTFALLDSMQSSISDSMLIGNTPNDDDVSVGDLGTASGNHAFLQEASAASSAPPKVSKGGQQGDKFSCLVGQQVLIDVSHRPTALQLFQSCRFLGMVAEIGDSRAPQASSSTGDSSSPNAASKMAVVGIEHAAEAIRASWKGRPIVVVGSRSDLPRNLHPLVVFLPLPAKHSRLSVALLKSAVMLQWLPGGARLADEAMSQKLITDLKNWRLKTDTFVDAHSSGIMDIRRSSLDNSALERELVHTSGLPRPLQDSLAPVQLTGYISLHRHQDEEEDRDSSQGGFHTRMLSPRAAMKSGPGYFNMSPSQGPSGGGTVGTLSPVKISSVCDPPPSGTPARPLTSPLWNPLAHIKQQLAASALNVPPLQPPSRPLRILVAEDNKVNQKVVLKVLQQICPPGSQPADVVENGLQVLEKLDAGREYDLILMDIHMPEMDGLEATRKICERFPRPEDRPRIVALSADTLEDLHDKCREAGIEEFIVKPFRVEDLRRVINVCNRVVTSRGSSRSMDCGTPSAGSAATAIRPLNTPAV